MQVKNRTEEMTRGSVQKSVVVLSRLPLYGQIQAVFSLPDFYFSGSDFSKMIENGCSYWFDLSAQTI
jgi:hypothetical protein